MAWRAMRPITIDGKEYGAGDTVPTPSMRTAAQALRSGRTIIPEAVEDLPDGCSRYLFSPRIRAANQRLDARLQRDEGQGEPEPIETPSEVVSDSTPSEPDATEPALDPEPEPEKPAKATKAKKTTKKK